jgi:hypothetical protein
MPSSSWAIVVGLIAIAVLAFWYDARFASAGARDAGADTTAAVAQVHAAR